MTVEWSILDTVSALRAIEEPWRALACTGEGQMFRGPDWLVPWWHAYHRVLGAELRVMAGYADGKLVCVAPLYQRVARLSAVKLREIRLLGDAGPRPPAFDFLVEPGYEMAVGNALGDALGDAEADWDVIDLQPLWDPSRARAYMANRLNTRGRQVDSTETGGARRIALSIAGVAPELIAPEDTRAHAYVDDAAALRKGLAALRRLSRLEWAHREEASPLADPEATQLLEEVTFRFAAGSRTRLGRLDDTAGEAAAVALVIDDGDRAIVVAMAVDPENPHAAARLLSVEARAAAERGRISLDVVIGANEYELPSLPHSRQRALRLRAYSSSPQAALARTYGLVARRVQAARVAPGAAAAGARAAWTRIRTAAANVADYQRLHLYRGELWTRGIAVPHGLSLTTFSEQEFDSEDDSAREDLVESLELTEDYCRRNWQRGDLVVLARLNGRPAGISWAARGEVDVPELDRHLLLAPTEAYIHDVFVAPQARGRSVAPAMLEYIARELRQRDFYRSWALIGTDNIASVRAFEKAAYAAVADVFYARMGAVDRLSVRPPDPEARKLLGLA